MRLVTMVRAMPAVWLAVPISVLAGLYVTLLPPADGYGVDATAKATASLPLIGAFCAACAAWEGYRLRRGRVWNAPATRSRLEIAVWALAPVVIVGLLAFAVAIAVSLLRSNASVPDFRLIAMTVVDLVAYTAVGFAAGLLLPIAVAGPLVIVATILWLAFLPAMPPVWLRHITGMFRDCCGAQADLSLRAVLASTIANVGFVLVAFIVLARRPVLQRAAAAVGVLSVSLLVAVLLVAGMTSAPVVARDSAALDCMTQEGVTTCVWPEHRDRAEEVSALAASTHARWTAAAIDAPTRFTEAGRAASGPNEVSFAFHGGLADRDDLISSLAAGLLPPFPECPGGSTGGVAFQYLEAWYSAAAGMSEAQLRERYDYPAEPYDEVLAVVEQLAAGDHEVRRDWRSRAEAVSQMCDDWPAELISVNP
jgi:hypothetical protein